MRSANLLLVVFVVLLAPMVAQAQLSGINLSERISGSDPWTGGCAPLNSGELKDILSADLANCQVRFSCGWLSGYLLRGEPVGYVVERHSPEGEWRRITRVLRCGNPARGRYFVPNPEPEVIEVEVPVDRPVPTPVFVGCTKVIERTETVEVPVRVPEAVEVTRMVSVPEVVYLQAPPASSPPVINPMQAPRLGAIPVGYTVTGQWRALVTATLRQVPRRPAKRDCGPGEPGPEGPPGPPGPPGPCPEPPGPTCPIGGPDDGPGADPPTGGSTPGVPGNYVPAP